MWKALIRKQLMEVNAWLLQNKKTGKKRSTSGIVGMLVLYVVLFGVVGSMFFFAGVVLCGPMVSVKMGWLYIDIMALLAIMMGVFGSVFNTYSTLYNAKDNEMLLSMPIPPRRILAVRLMGVWMWSIIYSAIVFVPALIVYWITLQALGGLTLWIVVSDIIFLLALSFLVLTLSCILGWLVAKIGSKLKNKNIVTVILSLAFIGIYYFCYSKAYEVLQIIVLNAFTLGEQIMGAAYPLYIAGRSGEGDVLALLMFVAVIGLAFMLVYYVMSRSFIKMATTKSSSSKKKYKLDSGKAKSVGSALLFKELKRFTSSSAYMLNCALGTVFLLAFGVFAVIKGDFFSSIMTQIGFSGGTVALIACAVLCLISSMNDISAPSVSLEGKNIWLVQSLPVLSWQVLKAKLKLHLVITEPAVLVCTVCTVIALKPQPFEAVIMIILPMLFVVLTASFGLLVNLKSPNLKWTDETVPIKQSFSVMLAMFGGWIFIILLGALYFAVSAFVSPILYLVICTVIAALLTALMLMWIKNTGSKIFAAL